MKEPRKTCSETGIAIKTQSMTQHHCNHHDGADQASLPISFFSTFGKKKQYLAQCQSLERLEKLTESQYQAQTQTNQPLPPDHVEMDNLPMSDENASDGQYIIFRMD